MVRNIRTFSWLISNSHIISNCNKFKIISPMDIGFTTNTAHICVISMPFVLMNMYIFSFYLKLTRLVKGFSSLNRNRCYSTNSQ